MYIYLLKTALKQATAGYLAESLDSVETVMEDCLNPVEKLVNMYMFTCLQRIDVDALAAPVAAAYTYLRTAEDPVFEVRRAKHKIIREFMRYSKTNRSIKNHWAIEALVYLHETCAYSYYPVLTAIQQHIANQGDLQDYEKAMNIEERFQLLELRKLLKSLLPDFSVVAQKVDKVPSSNYLRAILNQHGDWQRKGAQTRLSLAGADITGVVLVCLTFNEISLEGADMAGSEVYAGTFIGTNLRDAKLTNCTFEDCSFDCADLRGADFTGATFKECTFTEAKIDAPQRILLGVFDK